LPSHEIPDAWISSEMTVFNLRKLDEHFSLSRKGNVKFYLFEWGSPAISKSGCRTPISI